MARFAPAPSLSALALGAALLLASGCGSSATGPLAAATVSVADNYFSPTSVTITRDESVEWDWKGMNPHDVEFDDSTLTGSPTQTTGTFTVRFVNPGTYTYWCEVHGRSMSGEVVVK